MNSSKKNKKKAAKSVSVSKAKYLKTNSFNHIENKRKEVNPNLK
jgi:hypothetical protein